MLASGLAQVSWLLSRVRSAVPAAQAFLQWSRLLENEGGLFLWEAFVSGDAKVGSHVDDARIAIESFRDALPEPERRNAIDERNVFSLIGAALILTGWNDDLALLRLPCLVIRAERRGLVVQGSALSKWGPRANRYAQELERKLELLSEPHVAPLTAFVERLRIERGKNDVPWFDPTEAGIKAKILLLLEAPGPRAVPEQGSGFVSPDNNDATAENMWKILREAGVKRESEIVTWNIVPWYVGDNDRIEPVKVSAIDKAQPALRELLSLLPELRVVVLLGRKAAWGWEHANIGSGLHVLRAPHPSPRSINPRPEARATIVAQIAKARRFAGLTTGAGASIDG